MDVKKRKTELRKKIREINKTLTSEYCRKASRGICDKVIAMPEYDRAETVFCFVGVGTEPDTRGIIDDALHKGKRLCVPLCINDTTINAVEIMDFDRDMEPGSYGLLEPKGNLPIVEITDIDFAVIPCVTCDHLGNRLGHGRGYYDRYLENAGFKSAMICYEKVTVKEGEIPSDSYDKAIETVVTDA